MQYEDKRRYVFVAIDRATRWVFIDIKQHKTAASAKAFLAAVRKAAAFRIHTILTDNGKEFTDRLFGSRTRQPTGEHEFDQPCQAPGIEHRLTKPRTPKTNGMVERFNVRLSQVPRSHYLTAQRIWKRRCTGLSGCITTTCRKRHWGTKPQFKHSKNGR